MDKIISIWKPTDISSYDVIRKIKKYIKNCKVGHCGTLDPFAEGVLVVCLGKATKKVSDIMNSYKLYKTRIILGIETDTLDKTGLVIKKNIKKIKINKNIMNQTLQKFTGCYNQVPPYYSAKKINGVKMYKLARNDIFIRKKPSLVNVENIILNNYNNNILELTIQCGKGTYVRSLCRDIAYSLNTFGYVETLVRLSVGEFNKNNSINYEDIENAIT